MIELKLCPWRICGEKRMSATINGEYTYTEMFMPCIKYKCLSYVDVGHEVRCYREPTQYYVLWQRAMDGERE